jgi:hypothetical protein
LTTTAAVTGGVLSDGGAVSVLVLSVCEVSWRHG